jgi:aquaporin Z
MVFVFAYGAVSGGHFNPAVTTGVLAAGTMRTGEAIGYISSSNSLAVSSAPFC